MAVLTRIIHRGERGARREIKEKKKLMSAGIPRRQRCRTRQPANPHVISY